MSTIPAASIVSVSPNVLSAGGSALDLNGLFLTESTQIPLGTVAQFTSVEAVSDYFGPSATEVTAATIYFAGFNDSNVKPSTLLMASYNEDAAHAYLRGGDMSDLTLAELQAITPGTLTITIAGVGNTSASINLSSAVSFSNAATIIEAAFTTPLFAVTYDSVSGGFVFLSDDDGADATMVFPSNTIATALKLTAATGAVLSQGAAAAVPATFMNAIIAQIQNWATFATLFNPDNSGNTVKMAFAAWVNGTDERYAYICWDPDATAAASVPASSSMGQLLAAAEYSGTCMVWGADYSKAAFVCGAAASIDFTETNGDIDFAFKSQSGLTADVTDKTTADNLLANYYNFYGAYATANDQFVFFYNGSISGEFLWLDDYVNQIWLNNALQLAAMVLLTSVKSLPYNTQGYSQLRAAWQTPINEALTFGAIRPGVPLSESQKAQVNTDAGIQISGTIETQGYYLQILAATPTARAARQSPPCNLWYTSAGSIQKISLASILVQ